MSAGINYVLMGDAGPLLKTFAVAFAGMKQLSSSALGMLNSISGTSGGLSGLFMGAIKGAADMESTSVAFVTLTKSAGAAAEVMADLKRLAADTPFEFPEIAEAGKKLLAFKGTAGQVPKELRMIGDIGSLIGVPLGELAEIYGKARVQGRLFAEDVNQLTGRGIPIIEEFANQFGVTEEKVRGLVESGKIGFPQLEKAFKSMTSAGGLFFEGMAKQSKTFNGLWSTFTDNVGETLREFGKPILEQLKPILTDAIGLTDQLNGKARAWGTEVATVLATMRELFQTGKLGESFSLGLQVAGAELVNFLGKGLVAVAASFGGAMMGAIYGAFNGNVMDNLADGMKAAFREAMGGMDGVQLIDTSDMKAELANVVAPAMTKVKADMATAAKNLQMAQDAPGAPKTSIPQALASTFNLRSMIMPGNRLAEIGGFGSRMASFGSNIQPHQSSESKATERQLNATNRLLKAIETNTKAKPMPKPTFQ